MAGGLYIKNTVLFNKMNFTVFLFLNIDNIIVKGNITLDDIDGLS